MGVRVTMEKAFVVQWLLSLEVDSFTQIQISNEAVCTKHVSNSLGKGMNPIIFYIYPAMGK